MQDDRPEPIQVFYCYASKDKKLLEELEEQLSPLKRSKEIMMWSNGEIKAGTDGRSEIEAYLKTADVILLLVSPSFIASDLCYSIQIDRAIKRQLAGKTKVIPILLRPTFLKGTPLDQLQGLPRNNRAITQWRNRDEAFLDVVMELWLIIQDIMKERFKSFNDHKKFLEQQVFITQRKKLYAQREHFFNEMKRNITQEEDWIKREKSSIEEEQQELLKEKTKLLGPSKRLADYESFFNMLDKMEKRKEEYFARRERLLTEKENRLIEEKWLAEKEGEIIRKYREGLYQKEILSFDIHTYIAGINAELFLKARKYVQKGKFKQRRYALLKAWATKLGLEHLVKD